LYSASDNGSSVESINAAIAELGESLKNVRSRCRTAERLAHHLVKVGPEAAVLHSDRAKLDAIARNLVGNAVKFTERGRIEIGTRRDGEWVEISVRDTGVGIPRESLREIFEPFRRLGDGPPTGGVGLGLHIVARLVEMLGGRIEVESEVGRGSTFRVFLRDPVPPAWT